MQVLNKGSVKRIFFPFFTFSIFQFEIILVLPMNSVFIRYEKNREPVQRILRIFISVKGDVRASSSRSLKFSSLSKESSVHVFQAPLFRRERSEVLRFYGKKKKRIDEVVERILRIFFFCQKKTSVHISQISIPARNSAGSTTRVRFHSSKKKKREKEKSLQSRGREPFEFLSVTENFLLVKGALTLIKAPPGSLPF